jgi:hypothetical protein
VTEAAVKAPAMESAHMTAAAPRPAMRERGRGEGQGESGREKSSHHGFLFGLSCGKTASMNAIQRAPMIRTLATAIEPSSTSSHLLLIESAPEGLRRLDPRLFQRLFADLGQHVFWQLAEVIEVYPLAAAANFLSGLRDGVRPSGRPNLHEALLGRP